MNSYKEKGYMKILMTMKANINRYAINNNLIITNLTNLLYLKLHTRYTEMSRGLESEDRIKDMMNCVVNNCMTWPPDKTGRWVGYVQCLLIEIEAVTTVKKERDFTRPMFHELYGIKGYEIPDTIEL